MADSPAERTQVFISYSHKDAEHLKRLQQHLKPYMRDGAIHIWDDTQIEAGADWLEEIEQAIRRAKVAVLLVSIDFLTSEFISEKELPRFLKAAREEGARILPVVVGYCDFTDTHLGQFQAVNSPAKPLKRLSEDERDEVWVQVVKLIRQALASPLVKPTPPLGTTLLIYKGHRGGVVSVAWSPDSKYIVSGSGDITAQVWDVMTGQTLLMYEYHSEMVHSVAWSPDGKRIASGSADRTVHIWDVATGQCFLLYKGHSTAVYAVAWSADGAYLVSGSSYGWVHVWDAATGRLIANCNPPISFNLSRGFGDTCVAWSPDGSRVASGAHQQVCVWEALTGLPLFTFDDISGSEFGIAWSPDGTRLAASDNHRGVCVWNTATGQQLLTYTEQPLPAGIAWSPDGKRIASGNFDGTIQIWDATTGKTLGICTGHSKPVLSVAWSPDGTRIASACSDGTARVWSAG